MTHVRNGRAAKTRRQEAAKDRADTARAMLKTLLNAVGHTEECMECRNQKLINEDCQSPHCKKLRGEESKFYDEITDDSVTIKGSTMIAGVDY